MATALSLSLSLSRSLARSLCTSLLRGEVHLVDWNVQLYELLNRMSFSQHLTTLDLVWHSRPTTRNEAVGKSGKGNLDSFLYLL